MANQLPVMGLGNIQAPQALERSGIDIVGGVKAIHDAGYVDPQAYQQSYNEAEYRSNRGMRDKEREQKFESGQQRLEAGELANEKAKFDLDEHTAYSEMKTMVNHASVLKDMSAEEASEYLTNQYRNAREGSVAKEAANEGLQLLGQNKDLFHKQMRGMYDHGIRSGMLRPTSEEQAAVQQAADQAEHERNMVEINARNSAKQVKSGPKTWDELEIKDKASIRNGFQGTAESILGLESDLSKIYAIESDPELDLQLNRLDPRNWTSMTEQGAKRDQITQVGVQQVLKLTSMLKGSISEGELKLLRDAQVKLETWSDPTSVKEALATIREYTERAHALKSNTAREINADTGYNLAEKGTYAPERLSDIKSSVYAKNNVAPEQRDSTDNTPTAPPSKGSMYAVNQGLYSSGKFSPESASRLSPSERQNLSKKEFGDYIKYRKAQEKKATDTSKKKQVGTSKVGWR